VRDTEAAEDFHGAGRNLAALDVRRRVGWPFLGDDDVDAAPGEIEGERHADWPPADDQYPGVYRARHRSPLMNGASVASAPSGKLVAIEAFKGECRCIAADLRNAIPATLPASARRIHEHHVSRPTRVSPRIGHRAVCGPGERR